MLINFKVTVFCTLKTFNK